MPMDKKSGQVNRRMHQEAELKAIQDKFTELLRDTHATIVDGNDVPEIVECVDRNIPPPPPPGRKRSWPILAVLLLATATFLPLPFRLKTIGEVSPEKRLVVRSPYDGQIAEISVVYGQTVRPGDVLCRLNSEATMSELAFRQEKQAALLQQLAASQEHLKLMDDIVSRRSASVDSGLTSRLELDRQRAERDRAQLAHLGLVREKIAGAEALAETRRKLAQLDIRSPLEGLVMTPGVGELRGQLIQKGERICELASPGSFLILTDIKESDARKVAVGDPAFVRFPFRPGRTYRGRIETIGHFSGQTLQMGRTLLRPSEKDTVVLMPNARSVKTLTLHIRLDEWPEGVKYGMNARVAIPDTKSALQWIRGL